MTTTWNISTPTAPGDYIASTNRDTDIRRHWTGTAWSAPWFADDMLSSAGRARGAHGESQTDVEWLDGNG